jgi:hypothetical protein
LKLSDQKLGARIVALITSPNGYGKSNLAASFARSGRTKFYDFDGRMQGVKFFSGDKPYIENVEYDTYNHKNFKKFQDEIEGLQIRCPYTCVVIDSLTNLSTTMITYQMQVKGTAGKTTKSGVAVSTWDEINGETMMCSQMMDILKCLPCHVILTAHPIKKTNVSGDGSIRYDSITAYGNKVPSIIPTYFNEHWMIDLEASARTSDGMKRFLYTQPTPKFDAKTALPLPDKIDITGNPDIYSLIQKLLVDKGVVLDPTAIEVVNQ